MTRVGLARRSLQVNFGAYHYLLTCRIRVRVPSRLFDASGGGAVGGLLCALEDIMVCDSALEVPTFR